MVDVPGLVGDHEVVAALFDGVLKDHEILDQHFVHAAERLKAMQFVLAAFELDVPRLAGQPRAKRMNMLVAGFEQAGDRVLRQPVHPEIGMKRSQFARDRDVAAAVAKADRRRKIEDARLARLAPGRFTGRGRGAEPAIEKIVDQAHSLLPDTARAGCARRRRRSRIPRRPLRHARPRRARGAGSDRCRRG